MKILLRPITGVVIFCPFMALARPSFYTASAGIRPLINSSWIFIASQLPVYVTTDLPAMHLALVNGIQTAAETPISH